MAKAQHSQASGLEVELKFELTCDDVRRLLRSKAFKALRPGKSTRQTMRATYYDTPDLKLSQRGASLRVRKEGRSFVQCVKSTPDKDEASGFARHERQWPLANAQLVPTLLKNDAALKPLFKGGVLKNLQPIFSTEIQRQTRALTLPGGARVRCDIDQGRIVCGEREVPVHEMELELVSGDVTQLLDLAGTVTDVVPARLSARSKAYRGYTLYAGQGDPWVRAEPLALAPKPTAKDVLSSAMHAGLHHLIRNEDCVLSRANIEGVHQMRVAMRRMRSAITTYKRLLVPGTFEDLAAALQTAGDALGPARDWDVFLDEVLTPIEAAFDDGAPLAALRERAERRRVAAYRQADALIASDAYAQLLTQILHWTGPGLEQQHLDTPAPRVAADVLARRHAHVLKAGKGLASLAEDKRHHLRIEVKKARYAAEFFAPLYTAKKSRAYIRALRALQDGLGHLNDLANAERMMGGVLKGARGANVKPLAIAAGMVEGWYAHAQSAREEELLKAWKTFTRQKTFW